jgi:intein-encoded DNA endonuclease-like protein
MIQISKNQHLARKQIEFEQGFIFGAFEDGLIYFQKYKSAYVVEIEQKYKKWLETLKKAMVNIYGKKIKITIYQRKNGYYRLQCYSKAIYLDMKQHRKNVSLIKKSSTEFQRGYLRGVFDAEGYVNGKQRMIAAYSINEKLIKLWVHLLNKLGISPGKVYLSKDGVYQLPIYGLEKLRKFHTHIGFSHPIKMKRLSKHLFSP